MPAKNPLALVKEKFGDKKKLVEALEKLTGEALWVSRTNANKGLAHVSNAKLLKLHATFTEVKDKFGTRDKLVEAILEIEKRVKDDGYRKHLSAWPVPRLYDTYRSLQKRLGGGKVAPEKAAKAPEKKAAKAVVEKAPKAAKPKAPKKA